MKLKLLRKPINLVFSIHKNGINQAKKNNIWIKKILIKKKLKKIK